MSERATVEEAFRAFVEHHERLRAEFDRSLTGRPVTDANVSAHHEWQKAEVARFDAWLAGRGWTRAELFDAIREVALRVEQKKGGGA